MLFIIIFGTRGMTSTIDQGHFFCPICQTDTSFLLKAVRRWFTLYFIPIIPLDRVGQYVQCQNCFNELNETALQMQPRLRQEAAQGQQVFNAEPIE